MQAQRSLLNDLDETCPTKSMPNSQHQNLTDSKSQQDILISCYGQIAHLETSLKVSLETEKSLREQIATEIKTRQICEQELDSCRQEQNREREERAKDRERDRAYFQVSKQEVSEKAIKFIESEILALNGTVLKLGEIFLNSLLDGRMVGG